MSLTMEQVYFKHFQKISTLALRFTSHRTRSLIEHLILILAVCSFCVVTLCHRTFVYRGELTGPVGCLRSIQGFEEETVDVTNVIVRRNEKEKSFVEKFGEAVESHPPDTDFSFLSTEAKSLQIDIDTRQCNTIDNFSSFQPVCSRDDVESTAQTKPYFESLKQELLDSEVLYSYSREKGFLLLPSSIRSKHGITSQYVVISSSNAKCFGEPFFQSIIFNLTGPNTIIMNWLLALHSGNGYIYHHPTSTLTNLQAQPLHLSSSTIDRFIILKIGILLSSLFLFFITTTLVSFTLRETQDRMLKFTFLLQNHIRNRMPYAQLIMEHVEESLVFVPVMMGILFFLFEFFGDKVLAFMVLTVVWICEVFSVFSMRTLACMHFFPRVFFLYFTLFHVYFFSCPFGFSYTSLASTVLFLIHSMLFFWNRYELPAFQSGVTSEEAPRTGVVTNAAQPNNAAPSALNTSQQIRRMPVPVSFPSMSSLSRSSPGISRHPSANILFLDGVDDGDDSSYMVFMDGEVVMHRDRHSPSSNPPLPSDNITGNLQYDEPHSNIVGMATEAAARAASGNHPISNGLNGERTMNGNMNGTGRRRSAQRRLNSELEDSLSVPLLGSFAFSFWDWRRPHPSNIRNRRGE